MVSFRYPDNYSLLHAEIYHLRPGETMSVGAVGGVLANDAVLAPGTQIDYFTALMKQEHFTPGWDGVGQEFLEGRLSLGPSGEFSYTANPGARDVTFFEIFHYWIHTDEGDFVGMLEFVVGDNTWTSHKTVHTALHKGDFDETSPIVGEAKVDTLLLNHLPDDTQARIGWSREGATITLTLDGATLVTEGMERLQFSSGTLAFDMDGHAGQAYRLYKAALARDPDAAGLKYWTGELDRGMDVTEAAALIIGSDEFSDLYGTEPAAMIAGFYANILGRQPQAFESDYWIGEYAREARSMADILVGFSESAENVAAVAPVFAEGLWLI